MASLSDVRG